MAAATAPVITLTPAELDDRRLAVENTLGTMRMEGLDPDETAVQILGRYADGEIEFSETKRLLRDHSGKCWKQCLTKPRHPAPIPPVLPPFPIPGLVTQ
jgi:hypothetical protein